jgi:hypothetical protein
LPGFISLRSVTKALMEEGLGAVIHHALPAYASLDRSFCDWLVQERGRLFVLLDGLDEVPTDLRTRVARTHLGPKVMGSWAPP